MPRLSAVDRLVDTAMSDDRGEDELPRLGRRVLLPVAQTSLSRPSAAHIREIASLRARTAVVQQWDSCGLEASLNVLALTYGDRLNIN
jgi:hypothetical protein